MPFHAATLVPQNRHCRAMIADWLKLSNKKKVQPADTSIDPPVEEMDRIPLLALLTQEKQYIPAIPPKTTALSSCLSKEKQPLNWNLGQNTSPICLCDCKIWGIQTPQVLWDRFTGVPRAITKHSEVVFSFPTYCLWNKLSAQNVILFILFNCLARELHGYL